MVLSVVVGLQKMFMERWLVLRVIARSKKIDVVVGFMDRVKLDVMNVADVFRYVVWVCCSGVIDDANVNDISVVKSEGSVLNQMFNDRFFERLQKDRSYGARDGGTHGYTFLDLAITPKNQPPLHKHLSQTQKQTTSLSTCYDCQA
jgi:hypothetical protein